MDKRRFGGQRPGAARGAGALTPPPAVVSTPLTAAPADMLDTPDTAPAPRAAAAWSRSAPWQPWNGAGAAIEDDNADAPLARSGAGEQSNPYTHRVSGARAWLLTPSFEIDDDAPQSATRPRRGSRKKTQQQQRRRRTLAATAAAVLALRQPPSVGGRRVPRVRLATVTSLVVGLALIVLLLGFFVLTAASIDPAFGRKPGPTQILDATTTATLAVPGLSQPPTATATDTPPPNSGAGGGGAAGGGAHPTATPSKTSGGGGGGGGSGPRPTATAQPQGTATAVATSTPQVQPTATNTPIPAPTNTPRPQPTATETPRPQPTPTETPIINAGSAVVRFTPDNQTLSSPATLNACPSGCAIPALVIGGRKHESGSYTATGKNVWLQGPVRITVFSKYSGDVTVSAKDAGSGRTLTCTVFVDITPPAAGFVTCKFFVSSPSFVHTGNYGPAFGTPSGHWSTVSNPSGPFTQQVQHIETNADCTSAKSKEQTNGRTWATGFITSAAGGRTVAGSSVGFQNVDCNPNPLSETTTFTASLDALASAVAYWPNDARTWARGKLDAQLPSGYVWGSESTCNPSTQSWGGSSATLKCQETGVAVYDWTPSRKAALAAALAGKSVSEAQSICAGWAGVSGACSISLNGSGSKLPTKASDISIQPSNPSGGAALAAQMQTRRAAHVTPPFPASTGLSYLLEALFFMVAPLAPIAPLAPSFAPAPGVVAHWRTHLRRINLLRALCVAGLLAPVVYVLATLPTVVALALPAPLLLLLFAGPLALATAGAWLLRPSRVQPGLLLALEAVAFPLAALALVYVLLTLAPPTAGTISGLSVTVHQQPVDLAAALITVWIVVEGLVLPWLVFLLDLPWLAIAGTVAILAAGSASGTPRPIWFTLAALALIIPSSVYLLIVSHERRAALRWQAEGLRVSGRLLRRLLLLGLIPTLLLTGVALAVPLGSTAFGPLAAAKTKLLQRQPPDTKIVLRSPNGVRVNALSDTLDTSAPAPVLTPQQASTVLLTYTFQGGPVDIVTSPRPSDDGAPPLELAALETFNGVTWTAAARSQGTSAAAALQVPQYPAQVMHLSATLTLTGAGLPTLSAVSDGATPLPVFDQATAVTASTATPELTKGASATTPVTVAGWRASGPGAATLRYHVTAALLSLATVTASAALPADAQHQLTALPDGLSAQLAPQARAWVAAAPPASGAMGQMRALVAAMNLAYTYDPSAQPPKGTADPLHWFLSTKRGDELAFASALAAYARSINLPVRLAEGFLPGTFNPKTERYQVTPDDATIWVQLALPPYGFADFFAVSPIQHYDIPRLVPLKGPPPSSTSAQQATPPAGASSPPRSAPRGAPPFQPPTAAEIKRVVTMLGVLLLGLVALALLAALVFAVVGWRRGAGGVPRAVRDLWYIAWLARRGTLGTSRRLTPRENTEVIITNARLQPAAAARLRQMNGLWETWRYGRLGSFDPRSRTGAGTWRAVRPALLRAAAARIFHTTVGMTRRLRRAGARNTEGV